MSDKIQNAYSASKNIYDEVMTHGGFFSRLYNTLFWSGTDDWEIAGKLLACIPEGFTGTLLDVPAGTAVFTHEKWKELANAKILCLDYSEDMIAQARQRMKEHSHIRCVQGDVGSLPLRDESCDIVISMNGFHAFPDKEKAFQETHRVLKSGGKLIACFYIKGESKVTDWLVKTVLSKKGWFTPPFQTRGELKAALERMYCDIDLQVDGSIAYFSAVRGEGQRPICSDNSNSKPAKGNTL